MALKYKIDFYQNGNEKDIHELFLLAYNRSIFPLDGWKWRFKDNPFGKGLITLAWDYDLLVGHYAVSCINISINGQNWLAGLSGTTMTHPAYRGMGLFPKLALYTYQKMKDCGMAMVWGFPNRMSHSGFVQNLSWHDICEVPTLRLRLFEYTLNSDLTNEIQEVFSVDDRFDQLWQKVKNDYGIMVRRDRAYVTWRYFLNPNVNYRLITCIVEEEIKGYAVFKRYRDELQVVDLLIGRDDVKVGESLITFVIDQALKENALSVSLWLNVTHPLHFVLEKKGFIPEGPVTYFGALAISAKTDSIIYDYRQWYFTMSDSDVF